MLQITNVTVSPAGGSIGIPTILPINNSSPTKIKITYSYSNSSSKTLIMGADKDGYSEKGVSNGVELIKPGSSGRTSYSFWLEGNGMISNANLYWVEVFYTPQPGGTFLTTYGRRYGPTVSIPGVWAYGTPVVLPPSDDPTPPQDDNDDSETSCQIKAKSIAWGGAKGGLTFEGVVQGKCASKDRVLLDVYWSSSKDKSGILAKMTTLPMAIAKGQKRVNLSINGNFFDNIPPNTSYVIAGLRQKNGTIAENNMVSVRDVQVKLQKDDSIIGSVSEHSLTVIRSLLRRAGDSMVEISDLQRTPKLQANRMFNNLRLKGIKAQKALYGVKGDKVIDVYADLVTGLSKNEITEQRETIEQAMADKIVEIKWELGHSPDPKKWSKLQVIDLRPSTFSHQSKPLFTSFAREFVDRGLLKQFFGPGEMDPAFHLEIPQI